MNGNKTALVTGASSGIGKAFTIELAIKGYDLIITARREERLLSLAEELKSQYKIKVVILALDLTKIEDRNRLFDNIREVDLDLFVNNAGFGYTGPFVKETRESIFQMINLNVVAVTDLTHLLLPRMIERQKGSIIIVSSIASFQPIPYFSLYTATKTFELSFAQSLYHETKKHNVHVMALCPGKTDTEFSKEALLDKSKFSKGSMTPKDVASGCLKALSKKKWQYIPGIKNRFVVYSQIFFPKKFVARVASRLLRSNI